MMTRQGEPENGANAVIGEGDQWTASARVSQHRDGLIFFFLYNFGPFCVRLFVCASCAGVPSMEKCRNAKLYAIGSCCWTMRLRSGVLTARQGGCGLVVTGSTGCCEDCEECGMWTCPLKSKG